VFNIEQGGDNFRFQVAGSDKVVIKGNGNVGIGTANPSAKLQVSGGMIKAPDFYSTHTTLPAPRWDTSFYVTQSRYWYSHNSTDVMYLGESGNNIYVRGKVGIGTANPGEKLQVNGNIWVRQSSIKIDKPNTSGGWARGIFYYPTDSTGPDELAGIGLLGGGPDVTRIYIAHGNDPWSSTAGMHILTNGNVGIGTAYPSEKLHVNGNIRLDGRHIYLGAQYLYGDNSSALYWTNNHDTVTQMIFRDKQGTTYGRVYGNGDGANFGLLDGDGNWSYLAAKDNYTQFRVNNSAKMTILSNGKVGIGTANPSEKLDVEGNINVGLAENAKITFPGHYLYLQNTGYAH